MRAQVCAAGEATLIERLNKIDRPVKAARIAELLGVNKITIYKLAQRGDIPHFRVAGAVRFDTRAVARWVTANSVVVQ